MSTCGAVVVGVGTAGRVRIRDLLSPDGIQPSLTIQGFISRRCLGDVLGVKQMSLEDAVNSQDIQVAFICTENIAHEKDIRTFLQAGKHVCVEYPLALSYQEAVSLCDLAQDKGVILHVEHIELLTPEFLELKKEVAGKDLQEGTLTFTGGPLKPGFGFPAFSGIARLTWLVDLFGELSVTTATMEEQPDNNYMKMTAKLVTNGNRSLTWIEERGPGLPRTKSINFRFSCGSVTQMPSAPRGAVGLFMQDLLLFCGKLGGLVAPAELQAERARVLHCLQLAHRIQVLAQG